MKGIVFNGFLTMLEARFGELVLDQVIEKANLPSGAAYTSAGYYDHRELVSLVMALSENTGVPVADLVRAFGEFLFGQLIKLPSMDKVQAGTAFEFMACVDGIIHQEVKRVYPDAELPSLSWSSTGPGQCEVVYRSKRHLADLAHGMIEGCLAHYGEKAMVERTELPSDGAVQVTRFVVTQ